MIEQSDQEPDGPDTRRSRLFQRADAHHVPLRTILATVAIVVAVYIGGLVLYRLRDVLLLMLVGGFVALLLNPLVSFFETRVPHRRGFAVLVVVVITSLIFMGVAFAFGYPLVNATTHLANALPTYISRAEAGKGWIGHLLHHYHIRNWLSKNSSKLVTFANDLSKPALALGRGAITVLLALVTVFVFVVLLLVQGPKIRLVILDFISPESGEWITRVGAKVSEAALGYMLGNMLTSLAAGFVVFVTLWSLSVPFAILWALWVALVDFLPQIGGLLAGVPTVLFALVHSLTAGIVTGVVFIVYTSIENHVLNPVIMGRTVKINPLTVFLAIIIGAELGAWVDGIFGGFVAVLLAVPAAATAQVLVREIWSATRHASEGASATHRRAGDESDLSFDR